MTLMCLCKTYDGLIMFVYAFRLFLSPDEFIHSARVFLGLTESGLFPGVSIAQSFAIRCFWRFMVYQVTFYLSLWYRRQDVAKRIAIFFSAATIAGELRWFPCYLAYSSTCRSFRWNTCVSNHFTLVLAYQSFFILVLVLRKWRGLEVFMDGSGLWVIWSEDH